MPLYVRRISQNWVLKYNLFNFIQGTYIGYPVNCFSDKDTMKEYLRKIIMKEVVDTKFLREDVFPNEENIWLFVVDKEMETSYVVKVEFDMKVSLHCINEE